MGTIIDPDIQNWIKKYELLLWQEQTEKISYTMKPLI